MAGQMEFMEAIRELERIAETNDKQLSMEEIESYFMDMGLDEKQFDFICKYYESHNIVITHRVEKQDDLMDEEIVMKEDPQDQELVSVYLKEAERASKLTEEQMQKLASKIINGDKNARNLLIEANLSLAIEVAGSYRGKGFPMSDLIQESNIGLMMAVNDYEPGIHGSFRDYATKMIRAQIEDSLTEYNSSTRSAIKMANRINELNDVATAFAKEFEREAKPNELAERMGIPEEEVRELMKVSLDAIAVLDTGKIGE